MDKDRLDELFDAHRFHDAIEIDSTEPIDRLLEELRMMVRIRKAEEKIGDMVAEGRVKCPCHLAIGQEAIPVGISRYLRSSDRVFGTHRSHGHFLALGAPVETLFAEVLGKATGCSKGMGGSMHLFDQGRGFVGSVPIVSATISLSVGAALAATFDRPTRDNLDLGLCYFGDGATEEGAFHESLNFAANFKLPVLFVCENNLFSSHLHIRERQPADRTSRFAEANKIAVRLVEGNDLVAVARASEQLIGSIRRGEGPAYLEVITYRWRGHVGPREDIDVGLQRKDDLSLWKKRDPVDRLVRGLARVGALSDRAFQMILTEVQREIDEAWMRADQAPYPESSSLLEMVYQEVD